VQKWSVKGHFITKSSIRAVRCILIAVLLFSLVSAFSANYYWDSDIAGGYQPITGNWDSDSYWTTDGTTLVAWPGTGNNAYFAGADGAYTVSLVGNTEVDSIFFANDGYAIEGDTLFAGGYVDVSAGKSASIDSRMYGAGGLYKAGDGLLILNPSESNNSNGFTGVVTLAGGTVQVPYLHNMNGASPIGDPANQSAEFLVFDGGELEKVGATNSGIHKRFTVTTNGGSIVNNGTGFMDWALTNSVTLSGSGARTFTFGGTSTANNIFTMHFADNGGPTSIVKSGTGKWIIDNNHSQTGDVTIEDGTLQLGNNTTNGDVGGDIINNGSLVFKTYGRTYDNLISGTGSVTQAVNTVTFTADNTYSGGTTINSGTKLILGNNSTTGTIAGDVVANGTLTFLHSDTLDFSGNISGSGGVNVDAGGLRYTGAATNTGLMSIRYGATAIINGSYTGRIEMSTDAIFAGTGVVGDSVKMKVNNEIQPGDGTVGTLSIGNLVMESGSVLRMELDGTGSYDQIVVDQADGDVLLDGTILIEALGGFGAGTYNLIQYTGSFADNGIELGPMPVGYAGELQFNAGSVDLVVTVDNSPPVVNSFSPADGTTGIIPNSSLTINFDENVQTASGDVRIYNRKNDSLVATIAIDDSQNMTSEMVLDDFEAGVGDNFYCSDLSCDTTTTYSYDGGVAYGGSASSGDKIEAWISPYPDASPYDSIGIWVYAPASGVSARMCAWDDSWIEEYTGAWVSLPAETWTRVSIAVSVFDQPSKVPWFLIETNMGGTQDVYVDHLSFFSVGAEKSIVIKGSGMERGQSYAVQVDNGALTDITGNAWGGISDTTTWNFRTVNSLPVSSDTALSIEENTLLAFSTNDIPYTDADSNDFTGVRITLLPVEGSLFIDADTDDTLDAGEEVTLNQDIVVADIAKLKYIPPNDIWGAELDSLRFQVWDEWELAATDNQMLINVLSPHYVWDSLATAGIQPGDGVWDTDAFWTLDGVNRVGWPGVGNNARFSGADGAYNISLSGNTYVDTMFFEADGYTITGDTLIWGGYVQVDSGKTAEINSVIQSQGWQYDMRKYGKGTLILSGLNVYSQDNYIYEGVLEVPAFDDNTAPSSVGTSANGSSTIVIDGGILRYTGAADQNNYRSFSVGLNDATIEVTGSGALRFKRETSVGLSESGARTLFLGGDHTGSNELRPSLADNGGPTSLTKLGSGTWIIRGNNTATGDLTINEGVLQLGDGFMGTWAGDIVNNATLVLDRTYWDYRQSISGAGTINITAYSYFKAPMEATGQLNVASGQVLYFSDSGSYQGPMDVTGTIANIRIDTLNLNEVISGNGVLQLYKGTLRYNGVATFSGSFDVYAGNLIVNGSINPDLQMKGGTFLAGLGTLAGEVEMLDYSSLLPGDTVVGVLTVGGLTLNPQTEIGLQLGTSSDRIDVNGGSGDLVLDGRLTITAGAGFSTGTYTLLNYSGNLSNNGLEVVEMPAGYAGSISAGGGVVELTVTNDVSSPTLVALEPADDSSGVDPLSHLKLVFDEVVQAGAGNLNIIERSGDTSVTTIDISTISTMEEYVFQHFENNSDDEWYCWNTGCLPDSNESILGSWSLSGSISSNDRFEVYYTNPPNAVGYDSLAVWMRSNQTGTKVCLGVTNRFWSEFWNDDTVTLSSNTWTRVTMPLGWISGLDSLTMIAARVLPVGTDSVWIDRISAIKNKPSNTIHVELNNVLQSGRSYAVQIDNGTITDLSGNAWAGISDTTSWNFRTINTLPTAGDSLWVVDEDTPAAPDAGLFRFSDADNNDFSGIQITTLPIAGSLYIDADNDSLPDPGEAVLSNDTVSASDFARLFYLAQTDSNGAPWDSLEFKVLDEWQEVSTNSWVLTIQVDPVNDAPVIVSDGGGDSANVARIEGNDSITVVQATDIENDALSYTIIGGADQALMSIDANSGFLRFTSPQDFDAPADSDSDNVYEVLVRVDDGVLADTQLVLLEVQDTNDPPYSLALSDSLLRENMPIRTLIGVLSAIDPEMQPLTWSLPALDSNHLFLVSGDSLFSDFVADYEADSLYPVQIALTDGLNWDTLSVSIPIADTNETPFALSLSDSSVIEMNPVPEFVGLFLAQDPEDGVLSYTIAGGDDSAYFEIRNDSLFLQDVADYETQSMYELIVRVSDGVLYQDSLLQVFLLDSNEAPVIVGASDSVLMENVSAPLMVGTLLATDPENDDLTWRILANEDSTLFGLQGDSIISLRSANYELDSLYLIQIEVSDGVLSDTAEIPIRILDTNEAPQQLQLSDSVFAENNLPGIPIALITAVDPDGDAVSFSIAPGADSSLFAIANDSLVFTEVADYENRNIYTLNIQASDGELGAVREFTIYVDDVNESPHSLVLSDTSIVEIRSPLQLVGLLSAVDPDGDALVYSILDSLDGAFFELTSDSMDFNSVADYETDSVYSVILGVSDGEFQISRQFMIRVLDSVEPESLPSFVRDSLRVFLRTESSAKWIPFSDTLDVYASIRMVLPLTIWNPDTSGMSVSQISGPSDAQLVENDGQYKWLWEQTVSGDNLVSLEVGNSAGSDTLEFMVRAPENQPPQVALLYLRAIDEISGKVKMVPPRDTLNLPFSTKIIAVFQVQDPEGDEVIFRLPQIPGAIVRNYGDTAHAEWSPNLLDDQLIVQYTDHKSLEQEQSWVLYLAEPVLAVSAPPKFTWMSGYHKEIGFSTETGGFFVFRSVDLQGRVLKTKKADFSPGFHSLKFMFDDIPVGVQTLIQFRDSSGKWQYVIRRY